VIGFVHRALYTKHWGPAKSMNGTWLFFGRSKSLSSTV